MWLLQLSCPLDQHYPQSRRYDNVSIQWRSNYPSNDVRCRNHVAAVVKVDRFLSIWRAILLPANQIDRYSNSSWLAESDVDSGAMTVVADGCSHDSISVDDVIPLFYAFAWNVAILSANFHCYSRPSIPIHGCCCRYRCHPLKSQLFSVA